MNNKLMPVFFLIALFGLTIKANAGMVTTRYIYNNSSKPWSLFFLMKAGSIGIDSENSYPFKDALEVKLEPGQTQRIYYESHCPVLCKLSGVVIISDSENKSYCYRLSHVLLRGPYIKHEGITGPVVLNGIGPGHSEYGSLTFIGDSWDSWENGKQGRIPAPNFGATCDVIEKEAG